MAHILPKKGGIPMSSIGYIQLRAYTSNAEIPLKDVAITITAQDGTAIAMRLTDRNGRIRPIEIPVPDASQSTEPGAERPPFTPVNLYAFKKGYEMVESENVQVFPGTTTFQNLEMIPLSELPDLADSILQYQTPPQNL